MYKKIKLYKTPCGLVVKTSCFFCRAYRGDSLKCKETKRTVSNNTTCPMWKLSTKYIETSEHALKESENIKKRINAAEEIISLIEGKISGFRKSMNMYKRKHFALWQIAKHEKELEVKNKELSDLKYKYKIAIDIENEKYYSIQECADKYYDTNKDKISRFCNL